MAYLISMNVTQPDPASADGTCQVKVEWTYGDQRPAAVQINVASTGGVGDPVAVVDASGNEPTASIKVSLLVSRSYTIGVCAPEWASHHMTCSSLTRAGRHITGKAIAGT